MPSGPFSAPFQGGGYGPADVVGYVNHVLVFDVREEGKRFSARLPLGLAGEAERFLPRQIRSALEESEIDLNQLLKMVNNTDPNLVRGELIDIRDDEDSERRIVIHVE